MACRICASVRLSTELVASSRTRILRPASCALAIEMSWRWPRLSESPSLPSIVA